MGQVEMEPKLMGKSINMTMSPLPVNKRKRKFTVEDENSPEPPDTTDDKAVDRRNHRSDRRGFGGIQKRQELGIQRKRAGTLKDGKTGTKFLGKTCSRKANSCIS